MIDWWREEPYPVGTSRRRRRRRAFFDRFEQQAVGRSIDRLAFLIAGIRSRGRGSATSNEAKPASKQKGAPLDEARHDDDTLSHKHSQFVADAHSRGRWSIRIFLGCPSAFKPKPTASP
jgi:hypothetical protein